MNWESLASFGIVAVAAVLMVRGAFRKTPHKGSCCDACANSGQAEFSRSLQHRSESHETVIRRRDEDIE